MDTTLLSVVIDEENSDKVSHSIHGRPDCVVHPFKMEPKLHCETCFCVVCEVEAVKCKYWTCHCTAAARKAKKETAELTKIKKGQEKQVKVVGKKTDKKKEKAVASKNEAALLVT